MITYEDLLAVGDDPKELAEFVRKTIREHQSSDLYRIAHDAREYDMGLNTTIMHYQKMVTELTGRQIPDLYSPNHRSASNFFHICTRQQVQYLLGNGITWVHPETKERVGDLFDNRVSEAAKCAMWGGVAYGFWNLDRLDIFTVLEFAPYLSEESGAVMAGVRWWQVDKDKPLHAFLYLIDGYIEFLWHNEDNAEIGDKWMRIDAGVYCTNKTPYVLNVRQNEVDGVEIVDGQNYPSFPIVPLYANEYHQSELVPLKGKIDAYDMISSGFINDLDGAQIYWIIKGAGGMDDPDLVQFLDRLRTVGAAAPADGQEVAPVEINIPYEAREKLLDRLKEQLYEDAMLMNPDNIRAGNITATQIRAAYERQNVKTDDFEYQVVEFVLGILALMGIDDFPKFNRSAIGNKGEEIQNLVIAAPYLGQEFVTRNILAVLGAEDSAEEVLKQVDAESMERLGGLE